MNTTRRSFLMQTGMGLAAMKYAAAAESTKDKPNIVVIFIDDMGYGDMNYTGHPTIATPNLNKLVHEGLVMTQFYSASPVCSPSRASLLTGRYFVRTGVTHVLFPYHEKGLPQSEKTIADQLKPVGYKTGAFGKWHLGHLPEFLPTSNGFDTYFGIPYSNDMYNENRGDPPIPLMRDEEIIEQPCDQTTVTRRYTEESIKFMREAKDQNKPFFVYLAHTMPHVPLFRSEEFSEVSKRGLYGDVIEEIDWSVGRVMTTLEELDVDDNTMVIFTSDNGPWLSKRLEGGSAGLFREGKGTTWEGGVREPFIVRFPGRVPAGAVRTEVGTTMDIYTTCLTVAGAEIPTDRAIDGKNLMPVWQANRKSPHEDFCYFWNNEIVAIRSGKYKLHLRIFEREFRLKEGQNILLFDLENDPSEQFDLSKKFPQIVTDLKAKIKQYQEQITKGT